MRRDPIAPASTFLILNETQNAVFDAEFHRLEELEAKFKRLNELSSDESFNVLDLGGGNGLFADQLLARFPKATVTILDISSVLLSRNNPSNRKELIHGSIEEITDILTGRTFDYITMNWVLHHLVGNSYRTSLENCRKTLIHVKKLLKPGGMVIIAENMFDSYLGSNLASHVIYAITAIKWRWFLQWTKRFFNTAGVGVCFQSQRAWRRLFAEAGFDVDAFQLGLVWWWLERAFRRMHFRSMAIHLLFVKSVSHGHFFLTPKPVAEFPSTGPADRTSFLERGLQMSQNAVMIAGPLTEADVTELLNTLRKIEQRTQSQIYRAVILDIEGEPTIAEMQETIGRVFQPTPDRKPRFLTIPKPEAG